MERRGGGGGRDGPKWSHMLEPVYAYRPDVRKRNFLTVIHTRHLCG